MDIHQFNKTIENNLKRVKDLINRRMPVYAGVMAVSHFKNNFVQSGFVDGGLHPWKPSKRQLSGGKGAGSNYKTLLSSRNRLMQSFRYISSSNGEVTITNPTEYAQIHNEGGVINITTHPEVTAKMRKFAWAKYYEAGGGGKGTSIPEDALKWRRLALTKKTKLDVRIKVNIPKRQFMGDSRELFDKIEQKLDTEIKKILQLE